PLPVPRHALNPLAGAGIPDLNRPAVLGEEALAVGAERGGAGDGGTGLRIGEQHPVGAQIPHPYRPADGLIPSGRRQQLAVAAECAPRSDRAGLKKSYAGKLGWLSLPSSCRT